MLQKKVMKMDINTRKCEKKVDQFFKIKNMHTHTHNM
jgi:hypothetical protein